jgi:hypothetical protein
MPIVSDAIADPTRRQAMISDGITELEAELDERSGVTAMAMRAGYKTLRKLRPNMVESNLERLLPMWAPVLDPHVEAGRASGDLPGHFSSNADTIAEGLLQATDKRAGEANNGLAVKAYQKLRPKAKGQVLTGMPRLARLVDRHV